MTWSYTGDPSDSDKDLVRFLVGLTDEDDQILDDEEIEAILNIYPNSLLAGSIVAETVAGKFSRLADKTIGDYSISLSQLSEQYLSIADRLKSQLQTTGAMKAVPFAGGISKASKETFQEDDDRVKPRFKKGMDDNPRAVFSKRGNTYDKEN